jgi:tetratricopeptide (TPR) repeat protein
MKGWLHVIAFLLQFPSTESVTNAPHSRPPFLSHVDDTQIQQAKELAIQRHKRAVQKALENYPTSPVGEPSPSIPNQQLKKYLIHGPGSLPDFQADLERSLYVTDPTPLLSQDECDQVIQMAENHFSGTEWPLQTSGQYQVAGFYIQSVPTVHQWFVQTCRDRLFPLLRQTFKDFFSSADDLCVDNAYLFRYTPESGQRTDVHTDSGVVSFTIALNSKAEYNGGGTWLEGLEENDGVLEMNQAGQVTIRPGGLKHCGNAVDSGIRYIIGGFCMHQRRPELVRMLLTPDAETLPDDQLRAVEAAVVLNPACDAAYNILANEYDRRGDKSKARQILEYCLEHVHPSSGECAYTLGSLYMEQQLYDKARTCMEICLKGDPYDVDALATMAQVCCSLGDRQLEETHYKKLIEIPKAKPTALSTAYCNLGVLYEGKDEEVDFYSKALQVLPNAFAPRYSLACCYASRHQWNNACEAFRKAVDDADSPENADKAVRALYQAASNWIRSEHQDATSLSREALIERFQAIMGQENYNRLAAGR